MIMNMIQVCMCNFHKNINHIYVSIHITNDLKHILFHSNPSKDPSKLITQQKAIFRKNSHCAIHRNMAAIHNHPKRRKKRALTEKKVI